MVLADRLEQFLLHLESYLVYEKEHEVGHWHIIMFAAGCFFDVSTLKQVFAAISLAVAFKRRKVDYG